MNQIHTTPIHKTDAYPKRPLVSSTRESLQLTLEVKSGALPDDLYGYVFINTPNGTVNSALPYPKTHPDGSPNQEYSSPILGGAGYIFKFDLNEVGKISLQSNLLKPPSYYADEATKYGTRLHKLFGFRNMGIARLSFALGAAEQIGTAVIPVKFKNDDYVRLFATADLGRAYEFDAQTLQVTQPLGKLKDYVAATPPIVPWVFKLIQGTAHPTFDPKTQEFFTVNYTKAVKTLLEASGVLLLLRRNPDLVEKLIEEAIAEMEAEGENTAKPNFERFFKRVEKKIAQRNRKSLLHWWLEKMMRLFKKKTTLQDSLYLLRFTDRNRHQRWRIVDEKGENITIWQCMHQTSLSQDYIILIDAAFKLSLDVLMNNPFPNNEKINAFLRQLTTKPQMANTPLYLIKRSDLVAENQTVVAKKITLEPEFIHFTANYNNDQNLITLYTASNAAACLAEWVRYYDKLFPESPIEAGTEGILCVGSMDVGRVGKIVIDGETATIKSQTLIHKTGNLEALEATEPPFEGEEPPQDLGAHTWLAGFYTFRDFISPHKTVEEIKNIYWQFGALEQRRLTHFIYQLYKDYPNRIVEAEKVKAYSEKGIPLQIARLNTERMEIEDYYQFPPNYTLGAIQFVPRKRESPDPENDPSTDGYLFTTMINGIEEEGEGLNYLREVWLFDARNLKKGAICILSHPEFNFGFTLHPLWVADIKSSAEKGDLKTEYEEIIQTLETDIKQDVQTLFEEEIYPNFNKNLTWHRKLRAALGV
ncbi:carotenoid oxygenase family protein [Hugenholtzia roseola]|uniref:carotenoid oxygenase family protein n=1 Tax=Hugenholtzia roseola TaxID=1002 RepID=UPI0012B51B0C|nr:carotenoid oxygenase family protein [Hugenholtzia roseola]